MTYNDVIEHFKSVSYDELMSYIFDNIDKFYNKDCEKEYNLYRDLQKDNCIDIIYSNNGSIVEVYEHHIELSQTGKIPFLIEWFSIYYYDNQKDFDYARYSNKEIYI